MLLVGCCLLMLSTCRKLPTTVVGTVVVALCPLLHLIQSPTLPLTLAGRCVLCCRRRHTCTWQQAPCRPVPPRSRAQASTPLAHTQYP
jgi:hypothetical protein